MYETVKEIMDACKHIGTCVNKHALFYPMLLVYGNAHETKI